MDYAIDAVLRLTKTNAVVRKTYKGHTTDQFDGVENLRDLMRTRTSRNVLSWKHVS